MPITHDVVIEKIKRAAKNIRRADPTQTQSKALDQVAAMLGYNNWSMLSKHVHQLKPGALAIYLDDLYQNPKLASLLPPKQPPFDPVAATEEMRTWVEGKFTRLVEFAFHDNESETGYAWPDEDINNALQEEFDHIYPFELIEEVAVELELDGPWGIEDYGDDEG